MAAPPPEQKGRRLADFLRRQTAVPTQSLFRALNFELYTRGNAAVAVPGTVVFLGVLAYFAMLKSDEAQRKKELEAAQQAQARRREAFGA